MGNQELTKKVPLELLCLLLLEERDMYGYEMVQELKGRSGGLLSINITTLYLALKRLNEREFVSMYYSDSDNAHERSRLYYHFEPGAAAYKEELMSQYQQVVKGVQAFFDHCGGGEHE